MHPETPRLPSYGETLVRAAQASFQGPAHRNSEVQIVFDSNDTASIPPPPPYYPEINLNPDIGDCKYFLQSANARVPDADGDLLLFVYIKSLI